MNTVEPSERELLLKWAMAAMESPAGPENEPLLLCLALMQPVEPEPEEVPEPVFDRAAFQAAVAEMCLARREEMRPEPEWVNPLDDQDALDEVRRRVFGSAPNSKS